MAFIQTVEFGILSLPSAANLQKASKASIRTYRHITTIQILEEIKPGNSRQDNEVQLAEIFQLGRTPCRVIEMLDFLLDLRRCLIFGVIGRNVVLAEVLVGSLDLSYLVVVTHPVYTGCR